MDDRFILNTIQDLQRRIKALEADVKGLKEKDISNIELRQPQEPESNQAKRRADGTQPKIRKALSQMKSETNQKQNKRTR